MPPSITPEHIADEATGGSNMADAQGVSLAGLRPDAAMATAQRSLACWSRAWTQVAQGMFSASMAQMDLARSLYGTDPADWKLMTDPTASREAMHRYLGTARTRLEANLRDYRRINDELGERLFAAAEDLMLGMEAPASGTTVPSEIPARAKQPAAAAQPSAAAQPAAAAQTA
jgi:hypothetical protein